MKTRVYIDRLVLEGRPRSVESRDAIAAGLTRELEQRLQAHPVNSRDVRAIAAQVAQAVHEGTSR